MQVFERYAESGRGPVYMDCRGLAEEDYRSLEEALIDEGNRGIIEHFREEGIDPARNPIEFQTYELRYVGFIKANERAETTVRGLYSAGDESTFSISGAAVFGWIAGEEASSHAVSRRQGLEGSAAPAGDGPSALEGARQLVEAIQGRASGHDWRDANLALKHTMADYCGRVRSEAMLRAGQSHLKRLRAKIDGSLSARNRWELTRCLEVRNLYDLGEIAFVAALERQESRAMHVRSDYPYADPLLAGKLLYIKKIGNVPVFEWRAAPP